MHSTVYRYDAPVNLEPHTIRLRPRDDAAQRLVRHQLSISPDPAGRSQCLDQDGNVTAETWFDRATERIEIASQFEVETLRENPFDFLPRGGRTLPMVYTGPLRAALAPYTTGSAAASDLAADALRDCGGAPLEFLTALNLRIHQGFRYVERDDGPPHPAETTLRAGEGSCRDLAVLFCAAARGPGIAARFVSGYTCSPPREGPNQMHAWAEVYLEGGGWRGYDPSAGLAAGATYVAVAAAADPRLAAPITGSYRGAARSSMEFSIAIQVA
jgi:transglutaminase-like putative cysteine protease